MSIDKNLPPQRPSSILRSTSLMSLGTLASRILGFVRDIIFAKFFGTSIGADAFVVAFRLPNLFRDLLGEGAANSSFIPVLTEYKEKRSSDLPTFLNAMFAWAFIVLCLITLAGIVFAPGIVRVIAPGLTADAEQFRMTVTLTQMMFPYLVFIGMTAFFSAIQYTYGSFMMPALGPCLLNVALIVSTVASVWWMHEPVYGLAFGVIAGGILQLGFQWWPMARHNVHFHWPRKFRHPGAAQVGKLIVPRIIGSAVYQLNVFIDTICASLSSIVGAGGISAIYYANRLVLLPVGLFAVSLVAASLPVFSRHASGGRMDEFRAAVRSSLENLIFLMLPCAVILVLLANDIVRVMFQRGVFESSSTMQTAAAVTFFSAGLVFFGLSKVLAAAFHSLKDTKTPVKVAFLSLGVNAALNVVLMFPLKLGGIALASAIASVVSSGILLYLLQKKVGPLTGGSGVFLRRVSIAAIGEVVVLWGAWAWLSGVPDLVRLIVTIGLGSAVYVMSASMLGIRQATRMLQIVTFRKS